MWMSVRSLKEMPGIEFVVDARGRRKSVVIDLGRHGALWEDLSMHTSPNSDAPSRVSPCPR